MRHGIEVYERLGKITGVVSNGRKYRFKTLGIDKTEVMDMDKRKQQVDPEKVKVERQNKILEKFRKEQEKKKQKSQREKDKELDGWVEIEKSKKLKVGKPKTKKPMLKEDTRVKDLKELESPFQKHMLGSDKYNQRMEELNQSKKEDDNSKEGEITK